MVADALVPLIIETVGLTKTYDGVEALRGLSLAVPRGSIYGFLGRNGAGKTTTIKVLLGMARPTAGEARVFGLSAGAAEPSVEIRRRTGFVSDDKELYSYFTALSKDFEGTWEGAVESDGKLMRIVLKLSPAPDGTATAVLISVDKGNLEIPVTGVALQGKQLELDAPFVGGKYRGTLGAGGDIAGEWSEKTIHLPLTLKRAATK